MFSCEICKIFKNTFFEKHLQATASASHRDVCFDKFTSLDLRKDKEGIHLNLL